MSHVNTKLKLHSGAFTVGGISHKLNQEPRQRAQVCRLHCDAVLMESTMRFCIAEQFKTALQSQ